MTQATIVLNLPSPPSINAMFANSKNGVGRGRYKTVAYKEWLRLADACYLQQKRGITPVTGTCEIDIRLPASIRGDVDNRLKAAIDFLVSRGITGDDKHNRKVSIERQEGLSYCVVTITPVEAA